MEGVGGEGEVEERSREKEGGEGGRGETEGVSWRDEEKDGEEDMV